VQRPIGQITWKNNIQKREEHYWVVVPGMEKESNTKSICTEVWKKWKYEWTTNKDRLFLIFMAKLKQT
jgi:hypothetical protein